MSLILLPFLVILGAGSRRLSPPTVGLEVEIVIEQRIACSPRSITRRVGPSVVTAFTKKLIPSSLKEIYLILEASKKSL